MNYASTLTWLGDMAFDAELEGHHLTIDADAEFGGHNKGPRPKGLLLVSLAGCSGLDVVSILTKQRIEIKSLKIEVVGDVTDEHPKKFTAVVARFKFEGVDLPLDKLRRAVSLSEEKYCGVRATLVPTVAMRSEIWVNGAIV